MKRLGIYLINILIFFVVSVQTTVSSGAEQVASRTPFYYSGEASNSESLITTPHALATSESDIGDALGILSGVIAGVSFNSSDPLGIHIFNSPVSGFPIHGDSFLVLSTGDAAQATLPNDSGSLTTILSGLKNEQNNDLVQVELILNVPVGAKFWSVDWKFLSEEYPEFVGSTFNDAFFIETPSSDIKIVDNIPSSSNNAATDTFGSRVSINTTGVSGMNADNAVGTTYDGATGILTTTGKVNEGSAQITIIFSITDLGDSSFDTTVFLDNFRFDAEFSAPPPLGPPGETSLTSFEGFNPNLPTVVLTHGLSNISDLPGMPGGNLWTGTGAKEAASLIEQDVNNSVNIISYVWEDAFQVIRTPSENEYNAGNAYVKNAGANLAKELLKPEHLGTNYSQKIQFVGHSLGTIVNAYAAKLFLENAVGVSEAQITTLDRPDHISDSITTGIPGCSTFTKCMNYDEDFMDITFSGLQKDGSRNLELFFDNYFSNEGFGVGDKSKGTNVYNHIELINPHDLDDEVFDDEGADNNHSGVHQWYRWTMDPNGLVSSTCNLNDGELVSLPSFFDDSLNPCKLGWQWSIVSSNPLPLPKANASQPIGSITTKPVPIEGYANHGCITKLAPSGITIQCKELPSSSWIKYAGSLQVLEAPTEDSSLYSVVDVIIPDDAGYLSFEYQFLNIGDGDYAAVFLDNILVWTMAGDSYPGGGDFVESGPISISGFAGKRVLTVALYNVNEPNAQFEIRNISTLVYEEETCYPIKSRSGNIVVICL